MRPYVSLLELLEIPNTTRASILANRKSIIVRVDVMLKPHPRNVRLKTRQSTAQADAFGLFLATMRTRMHVRRQSTSDATITNKAADPSNGRATPKKTRIEPVLLTVVVLHML